MKTVLVNLALEERHKRRLEAAAPDCRFVYAPDGVMTKEMVQQAEIIVGFPPADWVAGSPRLEWLQLWSAGADAYLKPGVLTPGVKLTNATGAYGKAVSEHGLAMTLSLMKKLHIYRDYQQQHIWKAPSPR